jgi:hypothetical protein
VSVQDLPKLPWFDRFATWLLAAFLLAHLALALLVPDGAARMLVGDRAGDRQRALSELLVQLDLDHALGVIFRIGSPGDWVLFTPAYWLGGAYGVMAQSIVFYAVGLVFLYRLARLLVPVHIARLATVTWALLPATIFHPHALVSETICNPMLIIFAYQMVRLELAGDVRLKDLLWAGLTVGLLAFVRHVYLLLPLAAALWLLVFRPAGLGRRANIGAFLVLGFMFVAALAAAMALGSKRYELGTSVGGLESNLFLRADRMAAMGGLSLPQSYLDRNVAAGRELRALTPAEFAGFAARHPVLFAKTAVSDAFNLMANPGVAMLAGRYLGLFDLGERNHRDLNKWREMREREGPLGVARLLWETSPTGFMLNLAGGILWAAFLAFAFGGAYVFGTTAALTPAIRVLFFGLAAYVIVLTSATAGYTRWDHRSGIEFILAIWFALGLANLREKMSAGLSRLR